MFNAGRCATYTEHAEPSVYQGATRHVLSRLSRLYVEQCRALRDMNVPKFIFEDVPLFLGLIDDLFPGLDCPRVQMPQLKAAVESQLTEAGYHVSVAMPATTSQSQCWLPRLSRLHLI